ncbi:hypothetical protein QQ045_001900 [Rhodiola kirilowii]
MRSTNPLNFRVSSVPVYILTLYLCQNFRFFVDDVPIRVFKNCKDLGVRFPFNQPMKIYSSLWNADDWATRGGLEKTDWSKAPFIASYRGFHVDGCEASVNAKFCDTQGRRWWDQTAFQDLDSYQYRRLAWASTPFTTTAVIALGSLLCHLSATATETFELSLMHKLFFQTHFEEM